MNAKKEKIIITLALVFIIALGGFLRFYQLDKIPNGFFCDEATDGYIAYSILHTGRDLTGNFLPLFIDHHGFDKVEPLYTYLTILPVKLFGLTVFSTRFMPALFGTLLILSTFLLTREVFKNKKIALIASTIVALSPWSFIFSRIGFRGIFSPFIITLGLYFFLRALKKPHNLLYAALIFGISAYTYSNMKVVLPLIILTLMLFYRKELKQFFISNSRITIISSLVFIVLLYPIIYQNVFGQVNVYNIHLSIFYLADSPPLQFFINYVKHLSPSFLFLNGDPNIRHGVFGYGQILIILFPFIVLSLFTKHKKNFWLLLMLFLIGIFPAALAQIAVPHALRSIAATPFLEIIAAYGIYKFLHLTNKNRVLKFTCTALITGAVLVNSCFFFYDYFVTYPVYSTPAWQYGMSEAIFYAEQHKQAYDIIMLNNVTNFSIDSSYYYFPSYPFALFFGKIDPKAWAGQYQPIGKYQICGGYMYDCIIPDKKVLYIIANGDTSRFHILKTILNPDGTIALTIAKNKQEE